MSKTFFVIGLVFLFFPDHPCFGQPKLPYRNLGAQPCEYCQYGKWTAKKATTIFKTMKRNASVAFRVNPNEKVTAVTGVVITSKPGIGKALKNTYSKRYDEKKYREIKTPIRKNEIFYLLTYLGEDFYTIWFKGRILETDFSNTDLRKLSFPKSIWWVKIRNSKGQTGWTQMAKNFDGEHDY